MSKLFQSRKFLLILVDAVFGLAALLVGYFFITEVELQVLIIAAFATIQPVFIAAINGVAQEDAAAFEAGSHPNQSV